MPKTRHDPTLHSTGRHGHWATCSCGWRSATWTTVTAAHANFGRHLAALPAAAATEGDTP